MYVLRKHQTPVTPKYKKYLRMLKILQSVCDSRPKNNCPSQVSKAVPDQTKVTGLVIKIRLHRNADARSVYELHPEMKQDYVCLCVGIDTHQPLQRPKLVINFVPVRSLSLPAPGGSQSQDWGFGEPNWWNKINDNSDKPSYFPSLGKARLLVRTTRSRQVTSSLEARGKMYILYIT